MSPIIFLPFEKEIEPDGDLTLFQLARKAGVPLEAPCGGKRICGKCKLIVKRSDAPLPPPSDREQEVLGGLIQKGYRLACETVLTHGALVLIPEESRVKRQVILTSDTRHPYPVRLRPNVSHCYVEVLLPTIDAVLADRERLILALKNTYDIRPPAMDPFVLRKLPQALRSDRKGVTVILRDEKEIIDLRPGRQDSLFGVAFDVGTTTVVAFLMDLVTGKKLAVIPVMNPQIAMGDNVISRISFCQDQPGGLEELRASIVECLNSLIAEASAEARIDPGQIMEATIVGNTVMHHLLAGLDPRYLSMAPYPPVLQAGQTWKAKDLGIRIGASAHVHLLPLKAGFVGSDTIACILATGLHRMRIPTLLIDLGTNGEIVFGNRDRMLCCSTAAGPAFEGGHIRWGMRASPGAIERVKIDPDTLDVRWETIQHEKPSGLCGSGIISAVAEMIRSGIILGRGNFNEALQTPRLREGEDGWELVLAWALEAAGEQDIVITQKDVAELQMAKSAVHAGATVLMEDFGGAPVKRILLAGACGNYIDPLDACTIDLFPGCLTAEVVGVGNAAGHGSCLALLDKNKKGEAEQIAQKAEYRELAATSRFQELFVSSMFFTSARDFEDDF
jgi:uncharacterized 2Fe-2S/4Fe-4S cluster protein (DUF4445 family)